MIKFEDFGFDYDETDYPLEKNSVRRSSLIGSFQTIFTDQNSPYDENWDYKTADGFLEWTSEQDYEGLLAVDNGAVVGFAWGYRVDPENVDVDQKFPEELYESDQDLYDGQTFMIDEVGVMPEYRGQGVGKTLEKELLDKVTDRDDISRVMQRTQWSGENIPKLGLDNDLGFEVFTYKEGIAEKPVLQEVDYVGKPGSDERVYLWREVEEELE